MPELSLNFFIFFSLAILARSIKSVEPLRSSGLIDFNTDGRFDLKLPNLPGDIVLPLLDVRRPLLLDPGTPASFFLMRVSRASRSPVPIYIESPLSTK